MSASQFAGGGPVAVFKRPGPEWVAFEGSLDARRLPLVLQARAAWVRALRERVWFVGLRDERGEPDFGLALAASRSRAFPGARILRALRFGHGLRPEAVGTACRALAELGRRVRALRLHVELYAPEAELRAVVLAELAAAGFVQAARPRSYERTLLIDLHGTEEQLLASFHPTCRRHIRAVQKRSLVVREIDNPALAGRMNALVAETMARTGGGRIRFEWSRWIAFERVHPELLKLIGVFRNDESGPEALLGFVMGLRHGDTAEYGVAASTRIPGDSTPLLYAPTWQLMRWALGGGATTFDFGGITAGTTQSDDPRGGISDFKRWFGGTELEVGGEFTLEPSRWRSAVAASVSSTVGSLRALAAHRGRPGARHAQAEGARGRRGRAREQ